MSEHATEAATAAALAELDGVERDVYLLRRLRELENLVVQMGGEIARLREHAHTHPRPATLHDRAACREWDCHLCQPYRPPSSPGPYIETGRAPRGADNHHEAASPESPSRWGRV